MQPNLKNEWKWVLGFGFLSFLLIGLMTNFKFKDFEFQFHDTYYVFDSLTAFQYLTASIYIVRVGYMLFDLMTDRYRIFAFVVAFVNPIVILLMTILAFFFVQNIFVSSDSYVNRNLISPLIPALLIISLIVIQIIVEVKALRKVWLFIKG